MRRKILAILVALLAASVFVAPALAFGPENAENNPNLTIALGGTNVQMWLPSGVMNEWINNPALPGVIRVQVKDAAIFQINNAIVAANPGVVFATENTWFYLNQNIFAALLVAVGADPAIAAGYQDGAYMKIVYVGW